MMKQLKYFLLLILWLLIYSCQDDDGPGGVMANPSCLTDKGNPVINKDSVVDFSTCIVTFDYVPLHRYEYSHPVFNPNNGNEIIYLREDYEGNGGLFKQELLKYNFCTDEIYVLTDAALYGIDWSSKDWIIYTGYDQNLYKMKSNGDSLIQLTTNGQYNSFAKWNDSGTQYLYRQEGIGFLVADETGNLLDTLNGLYASQWSWDYDRIFFTGFASNSLNSSYGEYDLINKEINVIDSTLTKFLGGIKFNAFTSLIVFLNGNKALAFHNLTTNQVEQRITGYQNRTYATFDVSPDGKTIICSRSNLKQTSDCTIEGDQFLHLIDITGENERVLALPE